MTAQRFSDYEATRRDRETWGRLVESAVGAHLVNTSIGSEIQVHYWRDRGREVDFILTRGTASVAIVKSHSRKTVLGGMDAFGRLAAPQRKLLVGDQGIPLDRFLRTPAADWFG